MSNVTPNVSLVATPEAVAHHQNVQLPTQLNAMVGNPAHYEFDGEIKNAIINLQGRAREGSATIAALTLDEVRTSPLKHQEGEKLAARTIAAAEGVQSLLAAKAKEYMASSRAVMEARFAPNPAREGIYLRAADWIAREAKNGEGNGYKAIREAITEDPDFAVAVYNTSHRLLGLPKDHAMNFGEQAVKHWAPEALEYIDKAQKVDELAKRYPKFIEAVRTSYFSPFELAKVRTYVQVPS